MARSFNSLIYAIALVCASAGLALAQSPGAPAPANPAPAAQPDVDLKLFEKVEVDRSKGCSVVLWQANRDPEKDNFAYIFQESLAPRTHARQPARIKIGGQVLTMTRIATGGKTNGYNLYEHQLYKLPGANDYVILQLKLGELMGETVDVDSGSMNVVMQGRQVFRASVKGNAGCNTPAAQPAAQPTAPSAAAPASAKVASTTYEIPEKLVPKTLLTDAIKRYECNPEVMAQPATALNISSEKAIWEIPCDRFAYQASSVFALVSIKQLGNAPVLLTFSAPPGKKRSTAPGVLLNAEWDAAAREVTSTSLGRSDGDCGTLERHRVSAKGTFELVEYREKARCDGKGNEPLRWPLIFQAK